MIKPVAAGVADELYSRSKYADALLLCVSAFVVRLPTDAPETENGNPVQAMPPADAVIDVVAFKFAMTVTCLPIRV